MVVFSLYIHTDTLIQSHMSMTRPAPSKMGVDRSHLGGGQTDLENLVLFLALVLPGSGGYCDDSTMGSYPPNKYRSLLERGE